MYGYNPTQTRLDYLQNQRNMIDQQINSLQQMAVPPININNNIPQPSFSNNNFDFNGKWVANEQEAKGVANNNLPLIMFDKNNPIFYMKDNNGDFKTFKFEEVQQPPAQHQDNSRLDALESKLNMVIDALTGNVSNNTQQQEKALEEPKKANKGGK